MEVKRVKVRRSGNRKKPPAAVSSSTPTRTRTASATKETTAARIRKQRLKDLSKNFDLLSCVCLNHTRGKTVKEILEVVRKKFPGVEMRREDPSWLIRFAAINEMLVFRPQYHDDYRKRLINRFPGLSAEVVSSSDVETIATEAAVVLVRMLSAAGHKKKTVNVGVAGGYTIRALMRALAIELTLSSSEMPEVVHFRALAAGFNPSDPSTDPNAFVGFFDNRLIPVELKFTGLSAPAIVSPDGIEQLLQYQDIKDAFESMKDLDVVVTSGTSWHECGALSRRLSKEDREILEKHEIVGDLLWRPISKRGPIEAEVSQRAFTLVELRQLREFVEQGKQVLLVMAPCGICRELKGELLNCALEQGIVTELVVDTRSAGQALAR